MANAIRQRLNAHSSQGRSFIEARVTNLNGIYLEARWRIERRIAEYVKSGRNSFTGPRMVKLMEEVQAMFPEFEEQYRDTAKEAITYIAQSYYRSALSDLSLKGSPVDGFSKERLNLTLDDAYTHIAGATRKMSDYSIYNLRRLSAQVMREAALTGETRAQISKRLYAANCAGGFFQFRDSAGRAWNSEAYFDMLGRTLLHNTARENYLQACADEGSDIVTVSTSGNPCPKCAKWERRLLSISGKSKKYPPLQDAIDDGLFHPNCTHRLVAVPEMIADEDYDDKGRPLEGFNSEGREAGDSKDDWKEYRKEQYAKHKKKTTNQSKSKKEDKPAEAKFSFTPAATKEEALEYTKANIADNVLLPKNTPLDVLNAMNEHVGRNINELGFNRFLAVKETNDKDAIASMMTNNAAIGINRQTWREILQHPQRAFDRNVTAPQERNGIRFLAVDKPENFLRHVVDHEFGHAVYNRSTLPGKEKLISGIFENGMQNGNIDMISGYGKTSIHEFFAESFAMYRRGDKLPKEITEMIKKVMK